MVDEISSGSIAMFSVKAAATELGVSPSLVYLLCKSGKIRHERHGLRRGTIRIPREALAEYRRAAEAKPPPPELALR
ncbi:MAG: DNA-binding protein, partial [Gemmataceae bacterium]|nr:DNA-binding protein [Gemmataceae bacterium]